MPAYNTPLPILKEAVESILDQSFRDYEFIIIDDGSTNGSWEYLCSLKDKRIRLIRNKTNIGITKSLNIGLRKARGKYIARMDSDDISLPGRFEKQYSYMERHPDVIMCGSRVAFFGERSGVSSGRWRRKIENMEDYRIRLLFTNPGPCHPTFFLRHIKLAELRITYDENIFYAQDYDICAILSRYGKVIILDDVLVRYRTHKKQISSEYRPAQIQCLKMVQKKLLSELLGDVSDEEVDFHYWCSNGCYPEHRISREAADWYMRLLDANAKRGIYNQRKLRRHIERIERWLIAHTFTEDMSVLDKLSLTLRYVSFSSVIKMLFENAAGCYK